MKMFLRFICQAHREGKNKVKEASQEAHCNNKLGNIYQVIYQHVGLLDTNTYKVPSKGLLAFMVKIKSSLCVPNKDKDILLSIRLAY